MRLEVVSIELHIYLFINYYFDIMLKKVLPQKQYGVHSSSNTVLTLETTRELESECSAGPQGYSKACSRTLDFIITNSFRYCVENIPSKYAERSIDIKNITNLVHIADGCNSNIFVGFYQGERVVVKMIKERAALSEVAVQEFEAEKNILMKIDHPNIIRIKGYGFFPRRFIVLEFLQRGTLEDQLRTGGEKMMNGRTRQRRRSMIEVLDRVRELVNAFIYLHSELSDEAILLHRDLKPDNIGIADDGSLRLLDFGMSACVGRHDSMQEAYELTGNTGSLRYMAPEVALCLPYNEKVDVYSFGILLWQMISGKTPFVGMRMTDFHNRVIINGERPPINPSWPLSLQRLMQSCWHENSRRRPSFREILYDIDHIKSEISSWRSALRDMLSAKF